MNWPLSGAGGSAAVITPLASRTPITAVTNLFNSPRTLTAATAWFCNATLQTASTVRYNGAGGQILRYGISGQTYTLTAGHTYLHVVEARALSSADSGNYFLNPGLELLLRDGDGSAFLTTLDNVGTNGANKFNLTGNFNTYYGRFTAVHTGTSSYMDIFDDGNLSIPFTVEFGFIGLYDITGLTGVAYDSANNRYINLANTIEWYGDSLANHFWQLKGYAGWPKITANGVGGSTSAQMLTAFNANIATTPSRAANQTLVWTGHNDPANAITLAQSQANIQALTNQLTGDYRVFCPRSYNAAWVNPRATSADFMDNLSDWVVGTYGTKAVDIRSALLSGGDGSVVDTADIKWKLTPTSIRADTIHPNNKGDELLGLYAATQIGSIWS